MKHLTKSEIKMIALIFGILAFLIAIGLSILFFNKNKTKEISEVGQFLQGVAAIIAIVIAIDSGKEILEKIGSVSVAVGEVNKAVESVNKAVEKIDKVVERIDKNIAELTIPKAIFDDSGKKDGDKTDYNEKKNLWYEAVSKIATNAGENFKITDSNELAEKLVKTKTPAQAAKVLEDNIQQRPVGSANANQSVKVMTSPSNGNIIFSIGK